MLQIAATTPRCLSLRGNVRTFERKTLHRSFRTFFVPAQVTASPRMPNKERQASEPDDTKRIHDDAYRNGLRTLVDNPVPHFRDVVDPNL